MPAQLINGTGLANDIQLAVRKDIVEQGLSPNLAIVLVGNDPASRLYVSLKKKACEKVGITLHTYILQETATQKELLHTITFLNNDETIDAILLQLPLPAHFNEAAAINTISPNKDVDGFSPTLLKAFKEGTSNIIPGLAHGILKLIESTGVDLKNKNAVILSNSEVFADPIITLLQHYGAHAHHVSPHDTDLSTKTTQADILIVALGKAHCVTPSMVKSNAIIIDVGTNTTEDGYFGDVDPAVDDIVSYRSPVPGGVGPMTIALLLHNTLILHKQRTKK